MGDFKLDFVIQGGIPAMSLITIFIQYDVSSFVIAGTIQLFLS